MFFVNQMMQLQTGFRIWARIRNPGYRSGPRKFFQVLVKSLESGLDPDPHYINADPQSSPPENLI
jgi:hypothetical protein